MLILGGAAVVNALTGVDLYAASMLIPVGVILYTAAGGLKATFMCVLFRIYHFAATPDVCAGRMNAFFCSSMT